MSNTRNYVEGSQFWLPVLTAAAALFIIWLIVMSALNVKNEGAKKSLQYKEALFTALAGQPADHYKKLDQETKEMVEIGSYLRQQWDQGQTTILKDTAWVYGVELDPNNSSAAQNKSLLLLQDTPPQVILMGANKDWRRMTMNSWDAQIIKELLSKQKTTVPNWKDFNPRLPSWLGWPALFLSQLISFLFYLVSFEEKYCDIWNRNYPWHQLPWRRGWPILGMALLMPGALPLIVLYGFFEGWAWVKYFFSAEQKEKRQRLNLPNLSPDYSARNYDQNLLVKLKEKLGVDDHV